MSQRKPQDLLARKPLEGTNPLEHALNAERAVTLGRLGREVEAALLTLRSVSEVREPERRAAALQACADAVWRYFIQREMQGLMSHEPVIEFYQIPREVLARVGASSTPSRADEGNGAAPSLDKAACAFCDILSGRAPATIVAEDARTVALLDLRQFHPGHVLVIPRRHVADLRTADDVVAVATMRMVTRVARAVDRCFPADGLSIWHSAGAGANQEVPHLHFHVHPRRYGDEMLRIYPRSPSHPDRAALAAWGAQLTEALASELGEG